MFVCVEPLQELVVGVGKAMRTAYLSKGGSSLQLITCQPAVPGHSSVISQEQRELITQSTSRIAVSSLWKWQAGDRWRASLLAMILTIPSSWSSGVSRIPAGPSAALLPRCHHRQARASQRASSHATPSTQQVVATSMSDLDGSIVVVGGGPAGLATAVALQAVGLPAVVLERQGELSTSGTALGLWTNAWRALDALQAAEPLREQHRQVTT